MIRYEDLDVIQKPNKMTERENCQDNGRHF